MSFFNHNFFFPSKYMSKKCAKNLLGKYLISSRRRAIESIIFIKIFLTICPIFRDKILFKRTILHVMIRSDNASEFTAKTRRIERMIRQKVLEASLSRKARALPCQPFFIETGQNYAIHLYSHMYINEGIE